MGMRVVSVRAGCGAQKRQLPLAVLAAASAGTDRPAPERIRHEEEPTVTRHVHQLREAAEGAAAARALLAWEGHGRKCVAVRAVAPVSGRRGNSAEPSAPREHGRYRDGAAAFDVVPPDEPPPVELPPDEGGVDGVDVEEEDDDEEEDDEDPPSLEPEPESFFTEL